MASLQNIIPRRLRLFGKEYRKSILFAYSSPLSSFFWILSVVPSRDSNTQLLLYINEGIVYWALITLALGSIIGPMGWYWHSNRPFHVFIEWTPIEPESIDHRLKRKNMVRLRTPENSETRAPQILVTVFFEKDTQEYSLRLTSDGPLNVVPQYAPGNSEYDEDSGTITCNDVESPSLFFPLEIQRESEQSGVLEQYVYIKDAMNGDTTVLDIEVI